MLKINTIYIIIALLILNDNNRHQFYIITGGRAICHPFTSFEYRHCNHYHSCNIPRDPA